MNGGDSLYIWQASDWPQWRYDLARLAEPMASVIHAQGRLMGRLADVGMAQRLGAGTEAAAKLGIDHTPSFALDGALLYGTSGWELLQPQIEARM